MVIDGAFSGDRNEIQKHTKNVLICEGFTIEIQLM
jgi:hypothetical protein